MGLCSVAVRFEGFRDSWRVGITAPFDVLLCCTVLSSGVFFMR